MSARLEVCLRDFFQTYLHDQRSVSPNTIKSYRDTFKLFLSYLGGVKLGQPVAIEDMEAKVVLDFLRTLESPNGGRGICVHSRNLRLAAIQSFFSYVALLHPTLAHQAKRIAAIPTKRAPPKDPQSLTKQELEAVLAQPQARKADGIRDLAILIFLYNTGARAQEAADFRDESFDFDERKVTILGKGRRVRTTPLWVPAARLLKLYRDRYRRDPKPAAAGRFFISQRGEGFTRFGIRCVVKRYLALASHVCPTIATKRLSTHSFRHTTAVHLLQSKLEPNVIKSWLGHASVSSTSRYLGMDLEHKRRILEQFGPPSSLVSILDPTPDAAPAELVDWLGNLGA